MKKILITLLSILMFLLNIVEVYADVDSIEVSTLDELITALADDTINTVIVKDTINLPNGANINGNGKTVQVPKPFISEDGKRDVSGSGLVPANTSLYCVFEVEENATVNISDITIAGGYGGGDINDWPVACNTAGGVYINSGAVVTMTNTVVTRSYRGIYNKGKLVLKDSNIVRNSGLYGAGVQNETDALVIMDGCSFSENSASRIDGDKVYGGGSENKGIMILNNTTMANNYASEGGGGIHNWEGGVMYIINSTIVGNYASNYNGGGIYANRGSITAINSLIAYNIGNGNTSTYSDVARNTGAATSMNLINCVYGNAGDDVTKTNCIQVVANDFNNLFANYRNDGLFYGSGSTGAFKHPTLLNKNGVVSATYVPPMTSSKAVWDSGSYVHTYFDYSDLSNIKLSYKVDGGVETGIGSYGTGGQEVSSYYETTGRTGSVSGASEPSDDTYYTVSLKESPSGGSVTGATTYGDAHISGSSVTLNAIPDIGYIFKEWQDASGAQLSENDNYTFTVNSDIALKAIFIAHNHDWNYSSSNNIFETYCSTSGCKNYAVNYDDAKTNEKLLYLSFTTPSQVNYTGSPIEPVITYGTNDERNKWETAGIKLPGSTGTDSPSITKTYYEADDLGNKIGDQLPSIPSNIGKYIVDIKVSYGAAITKNATVSLKYEIVKESNSSNNSNNGSRFIIPNTGIE